jgi:hypothetical protein
MPISEKDFLSAGYRSAPEQTKPTRLQFDFLPDAVKELDALVACVRAASRAEVLRRSLDLFKLVVLSVSNGTEVILRKKDGTESKILIV